MSGYHPALRLETWPRGRRHSPAKGADGQNLSRGFESLRLRQPFKNRLTGGFFVRGTILLHFPEALQIPLHFIFIAPPSSRGTNWLFDSLRCLRFWSEHDVLGANKKDQCREFLELCKRCPRGEGDVVIEGLGSPSSLASDGCDRRAFRARRRAVARGGRQPFYNRP